jgi:PIN domain nuclease of toxin-antitoxin system
VYLLDTCTLLWLAAEQSRLSDRARKCIRDHSGSLFVSAISAFEIALRHEHKKLRLPLPPPTWWREALSFHGLREIPVSGEIAATSAMLPPLHNDPCDRLIIATAQVHRLAILTPDSHIRQYSRVEVEW